MNDNENIRRDEAVVMLILANESLDPTFITDGKQITHGDIEINVNNEFKYVEVKSMTWFRKDKFYYIPLDIIYYKRSEKVRSDNAIHEIAYNCCNRPLLYKQGSTDDSVGWFPHLTETDYLIGIHFDENDSSIGHIKVIKNFKTFRANVMKMLGKEDERYACLSVQYKAEGRKVTLFLELMFKNERYLKNIVEYEQFDFKII